MLHGGHGEHGDYAAVRPARRLSVAGKHLPGPLPSIEEPAPASIREQGRRRSTRPSGTCQVLKLVLGPQVKTKSGIERGKPFDGHLHQGVGVASGISAISE